MAISSCTEHRMMLPNQAHPAIRPCLAPHHANQPGPDRAGLVSQGTWALRLSKPHTSVAKILMPLSWLDPGWSSGAVRPKAWEADTWKAASTAKNGTAT